MFIQSIKKYFKKIKNKFFILKYFFIEEKWLILIMSIAITLISIYIFTNNLPEVIIFGSELIIVMYDISIAFLIGIILYFLQIFLPKVNKRKNAQRELNVIINDLTRLISLIIRNYYSDLKLWKVGLDSNPSKYIYNNIDEISKYIEDNLKLDDIIKFGWNKEKKLTFRDKFFKIINKFNIDYREIMLKYGDYLENETLYNLEQVYRNYIFINIREFYYLPQDTISKFTIKKLLQNMHNIQKTADKINCICK